MTSFFVSCASPTKFNEYDSAAWNARAMIRDKVASRSYVVHVDAIAKRPNQLRMDFTTPVGIELGTFILNDKRVDYYLAKQNKKRSLPASPSAMRPLIKTNLDPYLLMDVFFDTEPEGKGWKCERDKRGYLSNCNNSDKNISLRWIKRQNTQRAIEIDTASSRIQMSLKGFQPKVETAVKTFQL